MYETSPVESFLESLVDHHVWQGSKLTAPPLTFLVSCDRGMFIISRASGGLIPGQ